MKGGQKVNEGILTGNRQFNHKRGKIKLIFLR